MLEAGSVFVKSGLGSISYWKCYLAKEAHSLLVVKFYLLAGYSKSIIYRIRSTVCWNSSIKVFSVCRIGM